ncbi:MAG: hypothetical protein Q7T71_14840 [Herbiconiux sp.]|nr:hypothetical protein [Herbiconiux sp.]
MALLLARWPPGRLPAGTLVTWVPGHPLRTFAAPDSGRALAAALAGREDGVEHAALLSRSPLGRRQARRDAADRRAGATRLGLRAVGTPRGAVVLVDDVRTTGASLDHASRLLLEAGATSVFSITVAAAPAELDR